MNEASRLEVKRTVHLVEHCLQKAATRKVRDDPSWSFGPAIVEIAALGLCRALPPGDAPITC